MISKIIFIPHQIEIGLKFLNITLEDIGKQGMPALHKLSELDKGIITGLHDDFSRYVYGSERAKDLNGKALYTFKEYDEHFIIVLNEELDLESTDSLQTLFHCICTDIIYKNQGDNFHNIPRCIVDLVI